MQGAMEAQRPSCRRLSHPQLLMLRLLAEQQVFVEACSLWNAVWLPYGKSDFTALFRMGLVRIGDLQRLESAVDGTDSQRQVCVPGGREASLLDHAAEFLLGRKLADALNEVLV